MANDKDRDETTGELTPAETIGQGTLAVDLERANIDQLIATAHKYPRKIQACLDMMQTMAVYNEQAAENCVYSLPRGGKPIIGPSIGFANILSQAWGNNRSGARIVHIDRKDKQVHAEGAFLDLQTNYQIIVPVNRRISDKNGRIFNDDMIMVTGQAAASIARRNAILNAVPRALWFPIFDQALQIIRGSETTFAEKKAKAMAAFSLFGVKPEQVYMVLGLKGDADLNLDHIPQLRGMYAQLRDGAITVEEMFDPRRMTGTGFETVHDPLADEPGEEGNAGGAETGTQTASEPVSTANSGGAETAKPEEPKAAAKAKAETKKPAPAKAKATPAKAEAKPAAATEPNAMADAPPQQPTQGQPKAAEPEPEAVILPKDSAGYEAHATPRIAEATSASALENWWKGERDLRGTCGVVEDVFARLYAAYQEKRSSLLASKAE